MFSMSAKRSVNIVVTPVFGTQPTPSPAPEEGVVVVDASFEPIETASIASEQPLSASNQG